eukprot:TRINITY_DN8083_c0_g2_i1.p1 TRINITY_DN8083_c0_g2~~TRINITY_DN8083_c0_g2_i1.p1  ORF type:complete len:148 (+),score=21.32 TRINITY_DN8083_c0_g2_i1:241-684(+)
MYRRAGRVKSLTPKVNKKEKRKEVAGRAKTRKKFNRSRLPTVSLNRYKNKRQDDKIEPFFSLWAPKNTTTWSPTSPVRSDVWYPEFFHTIPSDKYDYIEISHHQEGHPRIRFHKEAQKQKISELTELVGSLNINESSEDVPQFIVYK